MHRYRVEPMGGFCRTVVGIFLSVLMLIMLGGTIVGMLGGG